MKPLIMAFFFSLVFGACGDGGRTFYVVIVNKSSEDFFDISTTGFLKSSIGVMGANADTKGFGPILMPDLTDESQPRTLDLVLLSAPDKEYRRFEGIEVPPIPDEEHEPTLYIVIWPDVAEVHWVSEEESLRFLRNILSDRAQPPPTRR